MDKTGTRLAVYLELEDPENAAKALEEFDAFVRELRLEIYRARILFAQGRIHEFRGELQEAIAKYEKVRELQPTNVLIKRHIGNAYKSIGDYRKAEEYLTETLKIYPHNPKTNLEMALLCWTTNDHDRALQHLQLALGLGEVADPEFRPAQLAREKMAEWQSSL